MERRPLTIGDKERFEEYLSGASAGLSPYAFANIYGWKRLFEISWAIEAAALCVFFTDPTGCFLYLPPLPARGTTPPPEVVAECFRTMDAANKHPWISRIENVAAADTGFFGGLGYEAVYKSCDYVYSRASLVALKGDNFKAKRSAINYFTGHNRFSCAPYEPGCGAACVRLYREWMARRAAKFPDTVYKGMLSDSLKCLETVLEEFPGLDMEGMVVRMDGALKAFTLGYRLDSQTFCVLFEVADLSVKGLSQFIFRAFCDSLSEYRFINAMDDSGLENLKKVKLSYRPLKTPDAYIVQRKHAD